MITSPNPFRTDTDPSGPIPDPYGSIPDRGPVRKNLISPAAGSLPGVTFSGEHPPAARCAGAKLDQNLVNLDD